MSYDSWRQVNTDGNAEEWLAVLYQDRDNPLSRFIHGTTWDNAVSFALRRLTKVRNAHPDPYYYGITRFEQKNVHEIHERFWKFIEKFDCTTIVTLNYDILVERALHLATPTGESTPLFSYGGFPYRQVVRKMMNVTTRVYKDVFLGDKYLIYKLHGSLNWAYERHSSNMKVHDDVRAVFRTSGTVGTPAVVPPISEKELPEMFATIWNQGRKALSEADVWLVCGYSMPYYDEAIKKWFHSIIPSAAVKRIALLDPNSATLVDRWSNALRPDINVRGFPGLPDALDNTLDQFLGCGPRDRCERA